VSAQQCAASASVDAEPVSTATNVFADATSRFAPNATTMVRRLSPSADVVESSPDMPKT
jgi:hypothetical protein